jgi:acetylornithine/N-succinyldiaminopimelate aminotransferase
VIERDGLLEHVRTLGQRWAAELEAAGHPLVDGVRGLGFLLGLHLHQPVAAAAARAALDAGFIVNAVAPDTIRLAPPLVLTADQAASFTEALPRILDAALASHSEGNP